MTRLDRIENKIDSIAANIAEMKTVQAVQKEILDAHMLRTELNEQALEAQKQANQLAAEAADKSNRRRDYLVMALLLIGGAEKLGYLSKILSLLPF